MNSIDRSRFSLFLTASVVAASIACGGRQQPEPAARVEAPAPVVEQTPVDDVPPAPPAIALVAGDSTAIEGATPTLRVTSPRNDSLIRTGNVMLRLDLRNWELASPQGPHVHVIVDNEPYIAVRDLSRPIDLNRLVEENLHHPLAEGSHVLRVFPSRGHHESVKDAGAFVALVVHYKSRTADFAFDARAPLLTYSRPKACNVAGERLLLDFFVSNVQLGDAAKVRVSVDGTVIGSTQTWSPHYIENLPEGPHSIRIELLDGNDQPIAGPFNDTARDITVAQSCS